MSSQPDPDKGVVLGLGLLHEFEPTTGVTVTPYAYFPVLQLPKSQGDAFQFVLGLKDHPVELGINILGPGVFETGSGIGALSFDGFLAGADIYFDKVPSLDLSFVNLKLPGEQKGSNRSLEELIKDTSVEEWITTALSVLGAQLSKADGPTGAAGNIVNSILQLLGLLGQVPGIDWSSLISDPSKAGMIFKDWFLSIASSADNLQAWLKDWYCIFNNNPNEGHFGPFRAHFGVSYG